MRSKGWLCSALALVIALVWVVGAPTDALALKQVSPLNGPEVGACDGPKVGKALIKGPLRNGMTKVKVVFRTGPPNTTFNVFWTCTTVANGCHGQACGFVQLPNTVTTDGTGFGRAINVIPGNPFPGNFVHLDVCTPFCGAPIFTATFGQVPLGAEGGEGALAGDPTD